LLFCCAQCMATNAISLQVKPTSVSVPIHNRLEDGTVVTANEVKVTVDGPQVLSPEVTQKGEQIIVSFKVTITGEYKISASARGQKVQGTPAKVDVKVGNTAPKAEELPQIRTHPVTFEVDAVDHEGKPVAGTDFQVDVKGPEQVRPQLARDGAKLQITFRTTLTKGTFNISVSHGGKPIFRSPFDLELSGFSASEEHQVARLAPLPTERAVTFSKPTPFKYTGIPIANKDVAVKVTKSPASGVVSVKNVDKGTSMEFNLVVSKPGEYEISLYRGNDELDESPFTADVPEEAFKR